MMRSVIVPILLSCAGVLMLAGCSEPIVPTSSCIETARGLAAVAALNADLLNDNAYGGSLRSETARRTFIQTPEYQSLAKAVLAENQRIVTAQVKFLNDHCATGSNSRNRK